MKRKVDMATITENDDLLTEVRRKFTKAINENPKERKELEDLYGRVLDVEELKKEFDVHGFLAPFVSVTRKSDGKEGTVMFQHHPRYYFEFAED